MRDELISVVVPVFNRGEPILDTLRSIIDQSYINFEIIVVDDGSTDQTSHFIESIKDSRLRYFKIKNSGGPAKPRNYGILKSKGKYIAFCDDDDIWFPDKLKKCVAEIQNGADMIFHNMSLKPHFFLANRVSNPNYPSNITFLQLYHHGNIICNSSVLLKKSIFNEVGVFDENPLLVACEDFDMWLRILKCKFRVIYLDSIQGVYFVRNNSISKDVGRIENYSKYLVNKYPELDTPYWVRYNFLKVYASGGNLSKFLQELRIIYSQSVKSTNITKSLILLCFCIYNRLFSTRL